MPLIILITLISELLNLIGAFILIAIDQARTAAGG